MTMNVIHKSSRQLITEAVQLYFEPIRIVSASIERLGAWVARTLTVNGEAAEEEVAPALTSEDARLIAVRALTDALISAIALAPGHKPRIVLRNVARALAESGIPESQLDRPSRYLALSSVYSQQGHYARALHLSNRAFRVAREAQDNALMVAAGLNIGRVHYLQANYPRALQWYSHISRRIPRGAYLSALGAYIDVMTTTHRLGRTYDMDIVANIRAIASELEERPQSWVVGPSFSIYKHFLFDFERATRSGAEAQEIGAILDELDRVRSGRL